MLLWIGMCVNAKHQLVVVHFGIGAKQAIPNGENIAKIRIRVGQYIMMVHPVHRRGNDEPTQPGVEPFWELDIGMAELGKHHGKRLIHEYQANRRAHQNDTQDGEHEAENTLPRMVAIGRAGIHIRIGMVNQMEAPHPAYAVFHPMDEIGAN